jgi:hypothetical protein
MTTVEALKRVIMNIPVFGSTVQKIYRVFSLGWRGNFINSSQYWTERYDHGRDSGAGSYGRLAKYKASVLNDFVGSKKISLVVELGCGDGAQLTLSKYPRYIGLDISENAIKRCKKLFSDDLSKSFFMMKNNSPDVRADLSISLDVIYHLVENDVFDEYMKKLFNYSNKYVIIYSSNHDEYEGDLHVRHRCFSKWIENNEPAWKLIRIEKNKYPFQKNQAHKTSFADFYFYEMAQRADQV